MSDAQGIVAALIPLLFAITVHEAAHGYVARMFGDHTAAMLGRITLNPIKHIDLIGTIIMPVALWVMSGGAFTFGYAKPVPVNMRNLRNPRQDMVWVAVAGPISNLVMALLWAIVLFALVKLGIGGTLAKFLGVMAYSGIWINVILMVFNLLPLPPLDGGRVLAGLLPPKAAMAFDKIEPYGFFILVGLLVTRVLDNFWLQPIGGGVLKAIMTLFGLQ